MNHYANRILIVLVLRITPKSKAKVCVRWKMSLSPPIVATDRSKAVIFRPNKFILPKSVLVLGAGFGF